MPKVKRPRIKSPERDEEENLPAVIREADDDVDYWWLQMRQKLATYAFGTIVCVAAMIALAAWMGGSLGAFGERLSSGVDVIAQKAGLSITKIEIVGLDPLVEERAREAADINIGDNMLAADPYKLRRRVEQLDAVAGVSVHRFWPDQVTIIAETREPLALWQEDGEWRVIDQSGRTFSRANPDDYLGLPQVVGPDAAGAAASLVTLIADFPELSSRMESAHRVSGRRWDLRFKGGVSAAMPEDERLREALAALNLLHVRNGVLDMPVTRIDARDPERFAIRPAPGGPDSGGA